MKRPLLVLFSSLGLSAPLLAQTDEAILGLPKVVNPRGAQLNHAARVSRATQAASTTVRVPARTSVYQWVASAGQWSPQATVSTTTYNAAGKTMAILVADSASQRPSLRHSYTRTPDGTTTGYLREEWTGTVWQNKQRFTNVFNGLNQVIEQVFQQWTGTAWENEHRLLLTYNSRGEQESGIVQYWTNGAWVTQSGGSSVFVYDAADRLIEETYSSFNPANGQIEPAQHRVYSYVGSTQLLDSYTYQTWNGAQWVNNMRQQNLVYDSQQRLTLVNSENWTGTSWQLAFRTTYTYPSATGSSVELQELPQGTGWVNDRRTSYEINSRGYLTRYRVESWTNGNWRLVSGSASLPTYNATDDLIIRQEQAAVRTGSGANVTYVLTNQSKTYYSDFQSYVLAARPKQAAVAGWQLAPNPTAGLVALTPVAGNAAALRTVLVLNGLGQVVWQKNLGLPATQTGTLDLGGLSAGVYTVQLRTTEGTAVRRLVKE
jgi:hypothetical protein